MALDVFRKNPRRGSSPNPEKRSEQFFSEIHLGGQIQKKIQSNQARKADFQAHRSGKKIGIQEKNPPATKTGPAGGGRTPHDWKAPPPYCPDWDKSGRLPDSEKKIGIQKIENQLKWLKRHRNYHRSSYKSIFGRLQCRYIPCDDP